ncbi:MAG: ATP-binding protein, partial [Planctomycetes bacterium]|nr:ATP-binding protein [Planctomycetota bacterium]
KRELPRLRANLYCFTVPKELRDFRLWGKLTYGDLIKAKLDHSELVCAWHQAIDEQFSLAGFTQVEEQFADHILQSEGIILVLGPKDPPVEYLTNLQALVSSTSNSNVGEVLDRDLVDQDWTPELVDAKRDIAGFLRKQLAVNNTLVVQGPPGTGKTHMIAELCAKYLEEGASVLVTALTNRALLEVAGKPALEPWLTRKKVYKSNLTLDEKRVLPSLEALHGPGPMPGHLILATFFVASGYARELAGEAPYDLVVVDEASQALLGMLAAAKALGQQNVWVGDVRQLPPVVETDRDKVERTGAAAFVDGLRALTASCAYPVYQLTHSHRLPPRAARYTGMFYQDSLRSAKAGDELLDFAGMDPAFANWFHPEGGPTLLQVPMDPADAR